MMDTSSRVEEPVIKLFKLENNQIQFNVNAFRRLIENSELGDCEVCVIGILGKARGGKSFFLNIIRSYLNQLNQCERDGGGGAGLFENIETLRDGFSWRRGENPCTAGIDILNEILVFNTFDQKQIAIILVDCQGSHDNATSIQSDAKLFTLCTLFSTIPFYNIHKNICEIDLQILEVFSKYGETFQKDDSNKFPFQSLWFLIRDWECSNEYGTRPGQSYLRKWLQTNDISEKSRTRNILKNLYKDLRCAILPHPGKNFIQLESLDNLDQDFMDTAETLISEIFSGFYIEDNVKKVDDRTLKLSDLPHYLELISKCLNDNQNVEILSMYQGTVEGTYAAALNIAEEKYKELINELSILNIRIPEDRLKDLHEQARAEAEVIFKESHPMCDTEMEDKYNLILKKSFDDRYNELKEMNRSRASLEEIKTAYNNSININLNYYEHSMEDIKRSRYRLESEHITRIHQNANGEALRKFDAETNFPHEQIKQTSKESLEKKIDDTFNVIREINKQKKTEKELTDYYDSLLTELKQLYNEEMKSIINSDYKIGEQELHYKHLLVQRMLEDNFKTKAMESYKEFNDTYLDRLKNEIISSFIEIQVKNSTKLMMTESNDFKKKAFENYSLYMNDISNALYKLSEKDLETAHKCAKLKALVDLKEDFSTKQSLTEKMLETIETNFIQKLDNEFETIKMENERKSTKEDVSNQIQNIINSLRSLYNKSMLVELAGGNRVNQLELYHKHTIAKISALESYKDETVQFNDKSLVKTYKAQLNREIEGKFVEIKQQNARKPWAFDVKKVFQFMMELLSNPNVQKLITSLFTKKIGS